MFREREILYDHTYRWNLKAKTNKFQESDKSCGYQRSGDGERGAGRKMVKGTNLELEGKKVLGMLSTA